MRESFWIWTPLSQPLPEVSFGHVSRCVHHLRSVDERKYSLSSWAFAWGLHSHGAKRSAPQASCSASERWGEAAVGQSHDELLAVRVRGDDVGAHDVTAVAPDLGATRFDELDG